MPLMSEYSSTLISKRGRAILKTLAYARQKPIYQALEDILDEALQRAERPSAATVPLSTERHDHADDE